jgi:magnesium transporter
VTPEARLADAFLSTRPAEAARVVDALSTAAVIEMLDALSDETAALTLQHMLPARAAACLAGVNTPRAAAWASRLPLAVAATLLRHLPPPQASAVLEAFPAAERAWLRALLEYPAQTVGAAMDPRIEVVPVSGSIEEALRLLRQHPSHVYYYVYVVDASHRLAGVLDLAEMLQASPERLVSTVMHTRVVRLRAEMPLSNAAAHPAWHELDALPVVTADDVFQGVLRHRTVRQLQAADAGRRSGTHATDALVSLGELYWLGLTGLLQGLASTAASPSPTHQPRSAVNGR